MLNADTLERLRSFRLAGFVDGLLEQSQSAQYFDLSFEERLALLVDREFLRRSEQRLRHRLKEARLSETTRLEEVDFSSPRGLNKAQFLELCQGQWLKQGLNVIITGPTGVGKSFLASALAHSIVGRGFSVRYRRTHHWLADFLLAAERNRFPQSVANHRRVPLLVFDEWMRDRLSPQELRLLHDLFDDRHPTLSSMFVSQLPVESWLEQLTDKSVGEAVLDRVVHNSIRIDLNGESMRKLRGAQAAAKSLG